MRSGKSRMGDDDDGEDVVVSFPDHSAIERFLNFANSSSAAKWTDVTVVAGEKTFHCHRMILGAHSRLMKEAINAAGDEQDAAVLVPDVEVEVVEAAMDFMYRGKISEDAEVMLEAAKIFSLGIFDSEAKAEELATDYADDDEDVEAPMTKKGRKRTRNKRFDRQDFILPDIFDHEDEEDETETERNLYNCCGADFPSKSELESHQLSGECLVSARRAKRMLPAKRDRPRRLRKKIKLSNVDLACCDTTYDDEAVLASHKENVHLERLEKDRYMMCCNEKILGDLKKHLESVHRLDTASERAKCCDDTFDGVTDLTKHCASRHGLRVNQFKRVICCAKSLGDVEEYKAHRKLEDHIECNHCLFLSKDERHVNLHMYKSHNVSTAGGGESTAAFDCKHCSRRFPSVNKRQMHEDLHDNREK